MRGKAHIRLNKSFFLYVIGTGLWLAFTTYSGSTSALSIIVNDDGVFARTIHAGCFSLSFFIIYFIERRWRPLPKYALVVAVIVSNLLFFFIEGATVVLELPVLVQYIAIAGLAFGSACGYCQWLHILSTQSYENAKWCLSLGSMILIILMFVFGYLLDLSTVMVVTFAVLAPLSILLMLINVRINLENEIVLDKHRFNADLKDVLLPILCAMALVLITPIAGASFEEIKTPIISSALTQPIAHACSLLILMIVWFVLKKDTTLPQFYCVFLPLFASLIFLISFLDPSLAWIVVLIGNCCFFFVSILMVTTCLQLAHNRKTSAVSLYCLFAGFMYLSNVVQSALELLAEKKVFALESYTGALLLLYVLVIPAFLIISAKLDKRTKGEGKATISAEKEGSYDQPFSLSDTERACLSLAQKRNLSERHTELLSLIALGRDVSYISEALYLSPNTIRSYRKDLYAALDIHSKQDLISLVEAERTNIINAE